MRRTITPDHIGLVGELAKNGVKLLLLEHQKEYVHFSDGIFAREKHSAFVPIDEGKATVITPEESRAFLAGIGIAASLCRRRATAPTVLRWSSMTATLLWATSSHANTSPGTTRAKHFGVIGI